MTVTIGNLTFDHAAHDERGDVLYHAIGEPADAATSDETPEGHLLRFDRDGRVVGFTLINVRWMLEGDGTLGVPVPRRVGRDQLADVLGVT